MASADDILDQIREPDPSPVAVLDDPAPEQLPEPTPEPASEGRQRGPDGKFVAKAKTETPEPTVDPAAPVVEGEAKPEGEAPAAPEPEPVPWEFRGSGRQITIAGALYKPGHGVFIPDKPESMDTLRQMLTHGAKYPEARERAAKAEETLRSSITRHQAENTAFQEVIGPLLNDVNKLVEFVNLAAQDPELARERLALQLQKRHLEIERQYAGRIVEAPSEGQPDEYAVQELAEQMDEEFSATVSRIWPEATPEQRSEVERAIAGSYQSFLQRATADDPRGRWVRGQVIPATKMLETFVRGERASHQGSAATPSAAAPTPPKTPAPARPQVPPSVGGPARNIAGTQAAKPKPNAARAELEDYWGVPLHG